MRTEEEYIDLIGQLASRHCGDTPDDRLKQLVRNEVRKQIENVLVVLLFLAAIWWAGREYGGIGTLVTLIVGGAWVVWTAYRLDFDPSRDRHLITLYAENLNRLFVTKQTYEAGEMCWSLHEKEFAGDKRRVVASDHNGWDGSWSRIYNWALELENLSPRQRRKRLQAAAHDAESALRQGAALAKREKVDLPLWAASALHDLDRR